MTLNTDVAIIGGGLAGLALADHLARAGRDWHLFEARARFGGRIKTTAGVDLGPSWFWQGQPRMAGLVHRFGLTAFDQYSSGAICFEDAHGQVHRDKAIASMQGSWRIAGGMSALVDALVADLPADQLHSGHVLTDITKGERLGFESRPDVVASTVVLALPPRVVAGLRFFPVLPDVQVQALQGIPTWMGGQAKFVAIYDTPFWRKTGLSGDASSQLGPLVEIHDASGPEGDPAALFGFVGVAPQHRQTRAQDVKDAALAQLGRLFGPAALHPASIALEDWAFQDRTATALDQQPLTSHPHYGLPSVLQFLWGGALRLGSTECAPQFGGYLEGALFIAEQLAADLSRSAKPRKPQARP